MPSQKTFTIEEVDRLLLQAPKSRAVSSALPTHLEKKSKMQLVSILVKICEVVSIAVPALQVLKTFLFLKPKWQKAIDDVIGVATMACGIVPKK